MQGSEHESIVNKFLSHFLSSGVFFVDWCDGTQGQRFFSFPGGKGDIHICTCVLKKYSLGTWNSSPVFIPEI